MMTVEEMIEKARIEINIHADRLVKEGYQLRVNAARAQLALENDDEDLALEIACSVLTPMVMRNSLNEDGIEVALDIYEAWKATKNNKDTNNEPKNP